MTVELFPDLRVSRETLDRLRALEALVLKWTRHINLVSRRDAEHLWDRHILDSAQLWPLAPNATRWVDLGAGGGFPGLVIGVLGAGRPDPLHLTLIDSDERKCAFLATAVRELGLAADVRAARIEEVAPIDADIVSARALAPLDTLLGLAAHVAPGARCLFPKGETATAELTTARRSWHVVAAQHASRTDPRACVLDIQEYQRAD